MTTGQKLLRIFTAMFGWFGLMLACGLAQPLFEWLGLFNAPVATAWAVALVACVGLGGLGFFWHLWQMLSEPAYHQARTHGLPAQARVLEVRATGARLRRRHRIVGLEYVIRVAVTLLGSAEYEANLVVSLKPALAPRKNAIIAVRVHRHRPEIVVWAQTTE